jgi:prefoldin subunit 5
MVYKDCKIVELNEQMTQQDRTIIDMQELVSEKDEVIRGRDKAIHILQTSIKEKDELLRNHESIIVKLTAKMDKMTDELNAFQQRPLQHPHAVECSNSYQPTCSDNSAALVAPPESQLPAPLDAASMNSGENYYKLQLLCTEKDAVICNLQNEIDRLNGCINAEMTGKLQVVEDLKGEVAQFSQQLQSIHVDSDVSPSDPRHLSVTDEDRNKLIAGKDRQIEEMEEIVKSQVNDILGYQARVEALEANIQELSALLKEKDDTVNSLEHKITDITKQLQMNVHEQTSLHQQGDDLTKVQNDESSSGIASDIEYSSNELRELVKTKCERGRTENRGVIKVQRGDGETGIFVIGTREFIQGSVSENSGTRTNVG